MKPPAKPTWVEKTPGSRQNSFSAPQKQPIPAHKHIQLGLLLCITQRYYECCSRSFDSEASGFKNGCLCYLTKHDGFHAFWKRLHSGIPINRMLICKVREWKMCYGDITIKHNSELPCVSKRAWMQLWVGLSGSHLAASWPRLTDKSWRLLCRKIFKRLHSFDCLSDSPCCPLFGIWSYTHLSHYLSVSITQMAQVSSQSRHNGESPLQTLNYNEKMQCVAIGLGLSNQYHDILSSSPL